MFDVNKTEVIKGKILDYTKKRANVESLRAYLGFISYGDAGSVYQRRTVLTDSKSGRSIQLGVGRIDGGLSKNPKHDAVYWVRDNNVEPPVFRWILQSLAGDFIGETPATDEGRQETTLHGFSTARGLQIADAMHSLLKEFEPPVITQSPRFEAAVPTA